MPHVIVKLYAGRTDAEKSALADEIAKAVTTALGSRDASISVSVEDVAPENWVETVYRPDIAGRPEILVRKPGYDPGA